MMCGARPIHQAALEAIMVEAGGITGPGSIGSVE